MHDTTRFIDARARRFLAERIAPHIYRDNRAVEVTSWAVPDEPVPFAEAISQSFEPFAVGTRWGRPWSTIWFRVVGTVPEEWQIEFGPAELVVDLGFSRAIPGFQAEGTAYSRDGVIVKAIESLNRHVPLGAPGSEFELFIEAAANPNVAGAFDFKPTLMGDKATAGNKPLYRLKQAVVAHRDVAVWELQQDLTALLGLAAELSVDLPRRAQILYAVNRAIEAVDVDDVSGTADAARAILAPSLASPASQSAHRISAVGHAHIDTAWLWPTRETVRKVARTFSNVLSLMDEDADLVFAASSAQQYAWLKESQPELFERVKARVLEGRFVPVGGMWVESDTNLPGGEALARQFVAGKKFFIDELGVEPLEVWLPDSFGYSAAMPQIAAAAGSNWFLTQKLSWNDTNRMPHHSFDWEGIDGTRIFTHFPPVDTYNGDLSASDLARAERQYAEKGRANSSLVPFGFGNGGGGPTREMLAAAHRTNDLEGSPRVSMHTPRAFFEAAADEYENRPVWSGELYLEFHRGTYTSQARTKRGNRRSEHLLREAELWATLASIRLGRGYPYELLERCWQTVLLQQFHDILPGSSIAWVHREAERRYAEVAATLEALIADSIRALAGDGTTQLAFNAGPYARAGAVALGASAVPSASLATTASETADGFVLDNGLVRVVIDHRGLVTSLFDIVADRELIPSGAVANQLQLFRDIPTKWDAWDLDEDYANVMRDLDEADAVELVDDCTAVSIIRSLGGSGDRQRSSVRQRLSLASGSIALDIRTTVDWHETQKLLKLAFPLDLHADRAASEIQFGHVFRPTHQNTSWDSARFETVAHRWVHVGEAGYGVAIANDSTYGHDIRRDRIAENSATIVRLSLLRAPLYPDPAADQGEHEFTISVHVGASIADAVADGYRLNLPLRAAIGTAVEPVLLVDNAAVVVEAVKLAEDRSGDVVVRLYEAHGSRATAAITPGFDYSTVIATDLLERPLTDQPHGLDPADSGRGFAITLRPFQVITLRFAR